MILNQFSKNSGGAGFFRAEGFEVAGQVIGDFYDTLATGHGRRAQVLARRPIESG